MAPTVSPAGQRQTAANGGADVTSSRTSSTDCPHGGGLPPGLAGASLGTNHLAVREGRRPCRRGDRLGQMTPDRVDGVHDVLQSDFVVATQSGNASARTSSRSRSRSAVGVPTSTLTPKASSSSTPIERISIGRASGSSSTRKSMSLPSCSSPRATETEDRDGSPVVSRDDRLDLVLVGLDQRSQRSHGGVRHVASVRLVALPSIGHAPAAVTSLAGRSARHLTDAPRVPRNGFCAVRASAILPAPALVAQGIEHRPPEA